ncbi:MAG: ABC transporter permease [Planctomycetaceae bacterium]|nr:ABC transporter permease [Planctomycetales bacterium]MCB9922513.1 ABC transporter permease [Planctomycetaceae bacterium]
MYWNTFKVGVKNLLLHKLRSLLTVLGVILGVGSVISMLAITEGSKKEALERIRQLGADNIIIRSVKPTEAGGEGETASAAAAQTSRVLEYGLKHKDLERLKGALPTIKKAVPIALVVQESQYKHRRIPNARILGTIDEFLNVKHLEVRRGRFITDVDDYTTANVAVLAAGAADRLFNYEDPIGKDVLLGTDVYRVIGVLNPQGTGNATPGGIGQQNYNEDIYIPLSCAQHRFGELQAIRSAGSRSYEMTQLNEITLAVTDSSLVSQTASMARKLLLRSHPRQDDFEIQVPLELLKQAEQEKRVWNLVLGSIAGISLLVGGIGIMNIMLASVTERTREIGIRRALGAKRWDITYQFLVETILLSSVGGLLGVALGISLPLIVSRVAHLETEISFWAVGISFSISVGIGVIFGLYPARRAAMMDPIQALRHE